MARHKDVVWHLPNENPPSLAYATLAVLMDIRDELKVLNAKASCYRLPRALDDLHSLGVAARRRKARK